MTALAHIHRGPLGSETAPLAHEGAGALLVFEGVIRPVENGARIEAIDYEMYRPMADDALQSLASDALRRFGLLAVRVRHSEGRVRAGECSFRLEIASAHRAEGLRAAEWFIDRMKQDAPIWKRVVPAPVGEAAAS